MENGSISERRDEKGVEKRGKNRRTGLFYDSHGRTIADSFVTFGEEFSQEGQEVAGVKRSSRIFAKRCLHYRLLPLSKRPSSRYYIVSKRICNRHLPSFGLRFQMLKSARQNGSPSLRFPPPSFPRPRIKNESFFSPPPSFLHYPHFRKSNFLSSNHKSFLAISLFIISNLQRRIIFIVADDTCYVDDGEKALFTFAIIALWQTTKKIILESEVLLFKSRTGFRAT